MERQCSRCREMRPASDFVWRGRVCAECRAKGAPSESRNLPRRCLHCYELKPPEAFAMGDGSGVKGTEPAYRRRRGICMECVAREQAEREQAALDRRATWEVDGRLVRRCSRCGEVKDLVENFYVGRRTPRVEYAYYCKPCVVQRVGETRKRHLADPERRRELLAQRARFNREWRKRNPDQSRQAQLKWRQRMVSDPQRHARHLEACRIAYRLKRERDGERLEDLRVIRATMPRDVPIPRLPAAALAETLERIAAQVGDTLEAFVDNLGLEPRSVRAWRSGERMLVQFDIADTALTRLGLMWWDVWPPEKYPQVARDLEGQEAA